MDLQSLFDVKVRPLTLNPQCLDWRATLLTDTVRAKWCWSPEAPKESVG
jgi:hypothetical protein